VVKVLNSAVANAEQKQAIPENLFVSGAWVDEGPTLKRYRPRAHGRATQIRRRTSHVTVVVATPEEEVQRGA
jgi:large subunit ribosomal protein L22